MRNSRPEWGYNGRRDGALSLATIKGKIAAFATLYDCQPQVRIGTEWKNGMLKTVGRRYLTVRVGPTEWRKAHDEQWLTRDIWYITITEEEAS